MRVKLQLVLCSEDGREETVTDIVSWNKDFHRLAHLGLTLAEAKQLLKRIQTKLLEQQIDRFLDTHSQCPDCGAPLKAKSYTSRSFRTLFGTFKLPSPRLFHCTCRRRKTTSFRPLSALLTASVAPELLFIEAKWSSLASYGLTVKAPSLPATPTALPSPILRRLSSTSQSRAAPCSAWFRGAAGGTASAAGEG